MSATNNRPPDESDDAPRLPKGLIERALAGPNDPRTNPALLELVQHMLPYAMAMIHGAFDDTKPRRNRAPTTGQMRELENAQHVPLPDDDPDPTDPDAVAETARRSREARDRATEAALRSAVESFVGHWAREFAEIRSLDELAVQLVRITYNRYQRRRRRDAQLGLQARSGRGIDARDSFLDSRPDGQSHPAQDAELRDFLEIRKSLDDGVLEGFSRRDRQIIYLHVTGHGDEEIVALVNRHGRSPGTCTLNTVRHVIDMFQNQVRRLDDERDEGAQPHPNGKADDGGNERRRGEGPDPRPPDEPVAG